jgi:imidazolonepropionase-like amidohydrolase
MPATAVSSLAADLVVLSADPAADVRNVRKIVEVMKDGRVLGPAQKP